MQGNSPDQEYTDPHGECAAEIARLKSELSQSQEREAFLTGLISIPDEADDVVMTSMPNHPQFGDVVILRRSFFEERERAMVAMRQALEVYALKFNGSYGDAARIALSHPTLTEKEKT